ncbi:Uncharacterised protein [Staphylococcus simiae]|nr:Uncharacterised protein [Staphylococcus simiae]
MLNNTELIVMLTHNDYTVANAPQIFEECKDAQAKFWGFKDKGLAVEEMKALFSYMKRCDKTTFLEIVEYTEPECLEGAKLAKYCGCDVLMGTTYFDSINTYCQQNNIKYLPFAGDISDRPSILHGDIDDIITTANQNIKKGIYGFDLLGYRYTGDAPLLIRSFVQQIEAPVCVAGSIDSYDKLDFIKTVSPWAFTIGSAFFDNKFNGSFKEQINTVCEYVNSYFN